jgi:hypothetical protein
MATLQEVAAQDFIRSAVKLRGSGVKERALIENLVSNLRVMFREAPAWIDAHIREAESQVTYADSGKSRNAFIDNLVGYTTIEYERDLGNATLFASGYGQVKQHAAGLLNQGAPTDKVLGVLSDTIEWRAYKIKNVKASAGHQVDPADIDLDEIAKIDVKSATVRDAQLLIDFLATHLGREGAHRLAAPAVVNDLGFESAFGRHHLVELTQVVADAFDARPDYVQVIEQLSIDFMGYINDAPGAGFDRDLYLNELYVVTLAKLLCANVIAQQALNSDDRELAAILDGKHFRAKGLENLVEYDYFGWLSTKPWVDRLVPVAREMQGGLRSYDFQAPAAEDLFGLLLAQLASRSQRLLLGQEATPPWLAGTLAAHLVGKLGKKRLRFLDMCCGSGSMLIEVVKLAKAAHTGAVDQDAVLELSQVATGFDIDPLAVMLAKVNWVVAAREWLAPFDGSWRVSIPIYQADSLFVKTPVGATSGGAESYPLELHKQPVNLPVFLVRPESRQLFDGLLDRAYRIGMAAARGTSNSVEDDALNEAIDEACAEAGASLGKGERQSVVDFLTELIATFAQLQRDRLNGIWAFVLRNSYRPGLVIGQFNGLISNPPWLALSKLADNPYRDALDAEATRYRIKPTGSSHLHTELATTFLLHAVDRYLCSGALVGVILPDAVLNGAQHDPLRRGSYADGKRPIDFDPHEVWRVQKGTFKNEAIVLVGLKAKWSSPTKMIGGLISRKGLQPARPFRVVSLAKDRTAWSDSATAGDPVAFNEIATLQGADVMPRRAIFFETRDQAGDRTRIAPIDTATSSHAYLLKDEKKLTDFAITPASVPTRFIFDVLISKHLVPFEIGPPARAFLPIERGKNDQWAPVSETKLAATPAAESAFAEVLDALGEPGVAEYFSRLDTRNKLRQQRLPSSGYLFVFGAGGGVPCAAYAPLTDFDSSRLIIDQTLYWTIFDSLDEAVYLTGLVNSDALNQLVANFQPSGAFGRRHVHELPIKVTPGFDSSNPLHMGVVNATRRVMTEYETARRAKATDAHRDPNEALARRRRALRELAKALPAYSSYEGACAALYAAVAPGTLGTSTVTQAG